MRSITRAALLATAEPETPTASGANACRDVAGNCGAEELNESHHRAGQFPTQCGAAKTGVRCGITAHTAHWLGADAVS